ncbi:hypothetical protein DVH24_042078 [Malus domestica]|uniref:Uncharacterized protein n=1 Tax=Malus domestica TaxID=3750 RepID=A0A498IPW9_MALDO|nr:hypothetical protein DVH24_042078 [Malus domestica]
MSSVVNTAWDQYLKPFLLAVTVTPTQRLKLLIIGPINRDRDSHRDLEAARQVADRRTNSKYDNNNLDWATIIVVFCLTAAIGIALLPFQGPSGQLHLPVIFYFLGLSVLLAFTCILPSLALPHEPQPPNEPDNPQSHPTLLPDPLTHWCANQNCKPFAVDPLDPRSSSDCDWFSDAASDSDHDCSSEQQPKTEREGFGYGSSSWGGGGRKAESFVFSSRRRGGIAWHHVGRARAQHILSRPRDQLGLGASLSARLEWIGWVLA